MKYIPALLVVSMLFTTVVSCKKDPAPADQNSFTNPNPVASTNTYLSKLIFSYDDGSGVEILDRKTTYVFDNLKRVTKLIDSSVDNTSLIFWETTEYFYQGNDTLPYKSILIGNPAAQIEYDTTTNYYTYNNTGLLIRDTGFYVSHGTGYYSVSSNQTYSYSGTMITGRRDDIITVSTNSYPDFRIDTAQTDANGNIIQNVEHKSLDIINSSITWDNHPSPFAKLSNFQSFAIFPFGETFFYEMPKHNNRLHITEVTSGSGPPYTYDEDLTGNYTYNADGYPIQILRPNPTTAGAYDKVVFEYKSL